MAQSIETKGLKELQTYLDKLPVKMEKNIMRGALRAGAKVIGDAAKRKAPVGQPSKTNAAKYGHYAGALRDSIRLGTKLVRGFRVIASVKAGGKHKGANVYYAHMIERGVRPHTITSKSGKMKFGGVYVSEVEHPGFAPQPFLRPALDENAEAAVVATAKKIKQTLQKKHGLDIPHLPFEGDE